MHDIPESLIKSELAKKLYADRVDSIKRIFRQYKRGFLTSNDVWNLYMSESCNLLFLGKTLTENGINIRCHTYSRWISMLMDYGDWLTGKKMENGGAAWLFKWPDPSEGCYEAAPEEQKELCFEILTALGFCIAEYSVCIPGIYKYQLHQRIYNDGSRCAIYGKLIDDGGLQVKDSPEGKTYSVFDSFGCEGVVTILSRERDKYSQQEYFAAEGFVRGYTSDIPRPIKVYLDPGAANKQNRMSVSYYFLHSKPYSEDLSPSCDSRWHVFEEWAKEKNLRIRAHYKRDFDDFKIQLLPDFIL